MTDDAPLTAQVLSLLRELPSGDVVRLPVADPALASIGSRASTLEEQATFLTEHLSTLPPAAVARFLSPPGAELITVDVPLPREDLPRRLAITAPVSVRVVLVPAGKARWAFIPKLAHVAYIADGEPLLDTLRAEIVRLVAADDPSPTEWLSLLPAPRETLESAEITLDRKERGPGGRSAALHRQLLEATKTREAIEVLRSVGTALHARADDPAYAPRLVGRDAELATLTALLGAPERQSVLLIGRERVGKSALLIRWLQAEHKAGRSRLAFSTSGAQLIAGMSGLGQWQERLRRVLEAAQRLDAVLVLEDMGDLFGADGGGHVDLVGTIRPWIQESKVRLVGELTPDALALFEPRDVGFFGALARVRLEPLTVADTQVALEARARADRQTPIEPEAITALLDLAERYLPYRPLPGKAIGLYEEVAARAEERRDAQGQGRPIGREDVLEAFSASSGIPVFLLREDRALYRDAVTAHFRRRLIGQAEAIRRVIDTICVVKAGLQPSGKPLATFLFVGPTGVGKTELARTLAEFLFGAPDRLVRFDMSEFADPLAAERLFRGTHGAEGLLTRQIRQQPFSVLLLDEIEKAHAGVFDLLLQITGEGRLTDARGRTAYFHNTIVIMTSNLGAAHRKTTVGIGAEGLDDDAYYLREVERTFRPELVNRLDRVIAFAPLTPEEVEQVAHIALAKVSARRGFAEHHAALEVSPAAVRALAASGYHAAYGARALRRELEDALVSPAAHLFPTIDLDAPRQLRLAVTVRDEPFSRGAGASFERGALRFQLQRAPARPHTDAHHVAAEVSALRQEATRARALEACGRVTESIETLVAQLAQAQKAKDGRHGVDVAVLQRDHHRLSTLWADAERPYQELLAVEELAIQAYLSQGDAQATRELAARAADELRRAMARVFLSEHVGAQHVCLRVREVDDARPLGEWVDALDRAAQARGWTVRWHLDNDRKDSGAWPNPRYFGPPRTTAELRERLDARRGAPAELLVMVEGPWSYGLLALEAGLHRYSSWSHRRDTTHFLVSVVAGRHEFTDEEWLGLLAHQPLDGRTDYAKRAAVRHLDMRREELLFPGGVLPCRRDLSTYWRDAELTAYFVLLRAAREAEET